MKKVYKSTGQFEDLSTKKLLASIKKSCLATNNPDGAAESIAQATLNIVNEWLEDKDVVTSLDLRANTYRFLQQLNPEAAYFYWHYHDII